MVNTLYITAAGSVTLDVRDSGIITGVGFATNNTNVGAAELSFNSSAQTAISDTTGTIAGIINSVGSGFTAFFKCNEPVEAGERLYLHSTAANTVRCLIYIEPDKGGVRPTRRRA